MKYANWTREAGESFLGEVLKTAQHKDVISFAGGLPAQEYFPMKELKACYNQVFEEDGPISMQYAETMGYQPLRNWVLDWVPSNQESSNPRDAIITTGSQQGLSLVAQTFIDPGDVILVESPTYLGALQAFKSFRPNIKMVPCDDQGILVQELENILTKVNPKFLYVIPNYQNPTGRLMSLARRKELIEVAKRFDLLILEDNPYGELRYEGEALPNLMELYDKVIYLGTFSKVLSPGLRVGCLIAQKALVGFIERAKEGADLFSNNPAQRAVYKYVTGQNFQDHILHLRTVYKVRRDLLVRLFQEEGPDAFEFRIPTGGLFVWAKIPQGKDSLEFLYQYAQPEKVVFVPGTFFYPDGRVSNEMRINFSCSSPEMITEGVKRLARAARKAHSLSM